MLVSSNRRGHGVGRALARAALLEALELGCSHAYVEVVAEQEALVAMFQDMGFEPEALLADFVRDGAGEFHDLMLLTHRAGEQWSRSQVLGLDRGRRMMRRSLLVDERSIEVSGRSVRVRVHGEGPPVLLINGLGANVAMWAPLLEQLEGFQVITFDAPGTGRSQVAPAALHDRPRSPRWPVRSSTTLGHRARRRARLLTRRRRGPADSRSSSPSACAGWCSSAAPAVPAQSRARCQALMAVMTPARHYSKSGYRARHEAGRPRAGREGKHGRRARRMPNWHQRRRRLRSATRCR